jgi:hypothetical protein
MAENIRLTWKHFPAGEHGFFRAPVLISGAREAVSIDGGTTGSMPTSMNGSRGSATAQAIPSNPTDLDALPEDVADGVVLIHFERLCRPSDGGRRDTRRESPTVQHRPPSTVSGCRALVP